LKVDLSKESEVYKLVDEIKPNVIYHLAAFTSAADSFSSPKETVLNNIACQINILKQCGKVICWNPNFGCFSAEVYGRAEPDQSNNEETNLNPTNPYAVSKLTQDFLGRQYFLSYGLKHPG